jgi:regulator of RNase E activity RraA
MTDAEIVQALGRFPNGNLCKASPEVRAMGFPVSCLGAHPAATGKSDPGEIDVEIVCGGVRLHNKTGDR